MGPHIAQLKRKNKQLLNMANNLDSFTDVDLIIDENEQFQAIIETKQRAKVDLMSC
jgi:hypothetical protein